MDGPKKCWFHTTSNPKNVAQSNEVAMPRYVVTNDLNTFENWPIILKRWHLGKMKINLLGGVACIFYSLASEWNFMTSWSFSSSTADDVDPMTLSLKSSKRSLISKAKPTNKMQHPTKSDKEQATTERATFSQINCTPTKAKYPDGTRQSQGTLVGEK